MHRTLFALAALAAWAAPAPAETLPLFADRPAEYVPGGDPVSFTLQVPALSQFTGFHVEVLFQTEGDPPALTAGATRPPDSAYPFGSGGSFTASLGNPDNNTVRLIIDGSGAAANTGGGEPLATITLFPGAGLTGDVKVSVDPATLRFAYFSEGGPDQPDDPFFIAQGSPQPAPVPAPAGWLLLAIGGLALLRRSRTQK